MKLEMNPILQQNLTMEQLCLMVQEQGEQIRALSKRLDEHDKHLTRLTVQHYKIAPLMWRESGSVISDDNPTKMHYAHAETILGHFIVTQVVNNEGTGLDWVFRWCVKEYYNEGEQTVSSLENGKLLAHDMYQSILVKALILI